MSHLPFLTRNLSLKGLAVADIGAGDGAFARALAGEGANVTAVEVDADKVAALGSQADGFEVVEGRGESLPFADKSLDLVAFMFSFHHVPADVQDAALTESLRVLKPGGRLHIAEPLAEGALTEILLPLEDETEILRQSRAAIEQRIDADLRLVDTATYGVPYRYGSLQAIIDDVVGIDPTRAARVPAIRAEIEARFERLAESHSGDYLFQQPSVAWHLAAAR
ncbi:class I SAM-dependent methyltransferase [Rhodobium gokarnense]|uniref:SAM-dependent methyltransferase n=1 Tax=Rhodobium gokarnense TaxID=364296 RepID=A0ABT3HBN7_9HYPH|nr:class I SAM-dependent methyltransferase [Rhodobium gokarnense]MCW2307823.1 SAM-dependent methyltransferase [Rhodobium gokarnense]